MRSFVASSALDLAPTWPAVQQFAIMMEAEMRELALRDQARPLGAARTWSTNATTGSRQNAPAARVCDVGPADVGEAGPGDEGEWGNHDDDEEDEVQRTAEQALLDKKVCNNWGTPRDVSSVRIANSLIPGISSQKEGV